MAAASTRAVVAQTRGLVEKRVADAREPNVLCVAWRSDHVGRAMDWWLSQLCQLRLPQRLIHGVDRVQWPRGKWVFSAAWIERVNALQIHDSKV